MDGIMHATIEEVAEYESRKEHKYVEANGKTHQQPDGGRDDKTWDRGHEQPFSVARVMMVVPVQGINELHRPLAFRYHVKDIPMHQVFEKGPEQHPAEKDKGNPYNRKIQSRSAIIERINN